MTGPGSEAAAVISEYWRLNPKAGLVTFTVTYGMVSAPEFDAALEQLAIGWRRLIRIGFREMALGYYWRTETIYNFRTGTFAPHRHALVAVELR
jgi:hypothetical protein